MTTETISTETAAAKWAETFARYEQAEGVYQEVKAACDPLVALQENFEARHGLVAPGCGRQATPNYFDKCKALLEAHPHYCVPDAVHDNLEILVECICDIQTELMIIPAPDLVALRWKLEHTAGACWEDHYIKQMQADIKALMVAA